jgi:hypothetical protein
MREALDCFNDVDAPSDGETPVADVAAVAAQAAAAATAATPAAAVPRSRTSLAVAAAAATAAAAAAYANLSGPERVAAFTAQLRAAVPVQQLNDSSAAAQRCKRPRGDECSRSGFEVGSRDNTSTC